MSVLDRVNSPDDLKKLNNDELCELAKDIRTFLVEKVSKTGGHLASNLGAVELTMAIHRVFDIPKDKLVFDVGHQCYVHKILTGRKDFMDTLRKANGLSGFPKPYESEYDCFVAGHASNSVSVGLGFAYADKLNGSDASTVVVIGDGALTGGMAYEGLCNAGKSGTRLILCFNDNGMSISKTVGSFNRAITRMRSSRHYFNAKNRAHKILGGTFWERVISRLVKFFKNAIYSTNIFEDAGFTYLGPVDGHNTAALETVMQRAKELNKPCIVHVITKKGKGCEFAENNPEAFHGASPFNPETGEFLKAPLRDFSAAMGDILCELAKSDDKLCAVTAAMTDGCGLTRFAEEYPERFFDVGIAEGHAMAFSSSLAVSGMRPVYAVYSTFLQRAFDQMIHDVALMSSHVVLCIDRAGIVGADGETHNGFYDVNMLRMIPGFKIFSPANYTELEAAVKMALYGEKGAVGIRYPRGVEPENLSDLNTFDKPFAKVADNGSDTVIITYGVIASECIKAASDCKCDVIKLNILSPLPDLKVALKGYKKILVVEETEEKGGIGEEISHTLSGVKIIIKAINGFCMHGSREDILKNVGLDADAIKELLSGEFI